MKRVLIQSNRYRSGALGAFWRLQQHPQILIQQKQQLWSSPLSLSSFALLQQRDFSSSNNNSKRPSKRLHQLHHSPQTTSQLQKLRQLRPPVTPYPQSPRKQVPSYIARPPYADSGVVPYSPLEAERVLIHDAPSITRMRTAARLAREILDLACSLATPGVTTDAIDACVHDAILERNAYPSPLNYMGFPKSLCSSVNEIICHGIPDLRPLQLGDVVSFDVSCYVFDPESKIGVHGDNCATVIVGDAQETNEIGCDWRGVPYKAHFLPDRSSGGGNRVISSTNTVSTLTEEQQQAYFVEARRLVSTTREALYAGIHACKPGGCLSHIGAAIEQVSDREGYSSVRKYRGHGISSIFHSAPYVRHYRNDDKLELKPGMIFTIEPMITQGLGECYEWDDDWTVSTTDGGLAAQFEHTVLITEDGFEILTQLHDDEIIVSKF